VGFRVRWSLSVERSDPPPRDVGRSPALIRWAVIGAAVLGVVALILVKSLG
jgi:hypothetical protein